jgi:hypothetical protein
MGPLVVLAVALEVSVAVAVSTLVRAPKANAPTAKDTTITSASNAVEVLSRDERIELHCKPRRDIRP